MLIQKNTGYLARLLKLHSNVVRFLICENTLKNRKISKEVFIPEIAEYIPAAIAEIVEKQEQGWSYIKDGF